jgi:uncharacterized protein (TIGR04255 family)
MSKLPHAPLIEVIFELHWHSNNPNELNADLNKFEVSLGGMFIALKQEFPKLIDLRPDNQIPLGIFRDKPTHRFMADGPNPLNYPIYQLGPGLLTVNTIDEKYDWDEFSALILRVNESLSNLYQFDPNKELTLVLKYLDFYKLDLTKDMRESYRELFKFQIDLGPAVPENISPLLLNIESGYKTDSGTVNFSLKRGGMLKNGENVEGIVFENGIQLKIKAENYLETLKNWLSESHEVISTFFKEITKGPTYESFK